MCCGCAKKPGEAAPKGTGRAWEPASLVPTPTGAAEEQEEEEQGGAGSVPSPAIMTAVRVVEMDV